MRLKRRAVSLLLKIRLVIYLFLEVSHLRYIFSVVDQHPLLLMEGRTKSNVLGVALCGDFVAGPVEMELEIWRILHWVVIERYGN